jgi:hypothetical protein
MNLLRRTRHCLVCNVEYPRSIGAGIGGGFCSEVHHALAWADCINTVRTCRFLVCDCPRDRCHLRLACGKRTRGRLDGRCLKCGHYEDAHGRRPRSSFSYEAAGGQS